jgi:perosamine synthetase
VAERCSALRHQAYAGPAYVHDRVGYNFRMTELQAAIGLVQLGRLAAITERRRRIASYYDEAIGSERLDRPPSLPDACHVYHQYTLRLAGADGGARAERDRIRGLLAGCGVATGVYYPVPVHRQPAYRSHAATRCPNAERACDDMYSIPIHHSLSDDEVAAVARAVDGLP